MEKRAVEIRVGGHTHRLVTSLDASTLRGLAAEVDERLGRLKTGQQLHPQALLLVALGLAQDLAAERERSRTISARSQEMLADLLARVDEALGAVDEHGEPLGAPPSSTTADEHD